MSRKFSKIFRGLKFPLGSEPTDCEAGDMFYDNASGKFKAKEAGDSAAKNLIGSAGAGPANAVAFPDGNTALMGTVDGTLEFVNDQLFIRMNGAWRMVTTAPFNGPSLLEFIPAALAGAQPELTTVGNYTCGAGNSPKTATLEATPQGQLPQGVSFDDHDEDFAKFEVYDHVPTYGNGSIRTKAGESLAAETTYYFTLRMSNAVGSVTAACAVAVGATATTTTVTSAEETIYTIGEGDRRYHLSFNVNSSAGFTTGDTIIVLHEYAGSGPVSETTTIKTIEGNKIVTDLWQSGPYAGTDFEPYTYSDPTATVTKV